MSELHDDIELMELLDAISRDAMDDRSWARLEEVLLESRDARVLYRRYVNSHVALKQYLTACDAAPPARPRTSPVLGFLGESVHKLADFCWGPVSFSILVAVALPLLCILLLATQLRGPREALPRPLASRPVCVARLGRTFECEWMDKAIVPGKGMPLLIGQRLDLERGLAEILMANGTTVLIEGPTSLLVDSDWQLSLDSGRLTARVPKQATGFTVRAAGFSIVDIGTEFGVEVSDQRDAAEVEVFRGEVELTSAGPANRQSMVYRRLPAGQAVRIESNERQGAVLINDIPIVADRFVRQLPPDDVPAASTSIDREPRANSIVADFSGGAGDSEVNQFPGSAGRGWTSGWEIVHAEQVDMAVSVVNDMPLHGGGEHIKVTAFGTPGTDLLRATVVRPFDLAGPVDLKRPHVVSFDIRIDQMSQLDHSADGMTLCNNSKHARELTEDISGGWHIRILPADPKQPTVKHWTFTSGDGKGRSRGIDSKIVVREGSIYSFRIVVDPQSQTWIPSIAVDGGPAVEFAPMGTRSAGTAEQRGYWPYIHFRCEMQGDGKRETRKAIGFSLDSLQITPAETRPTP